MLYTDLFYLLFCVFVLQAVWLLQVSFIEKNLYLLLFQYVAVVLCQGIVLANPEHVYVGFS